MCFKQVNAVMYAMRSQQLLLLLRLPIRSCGFCLIQDIFVIYTIEFYATDIVHANGARKRLCAVYIYVCYVASPLIRNIRF